MTKLSRSALKGLIKECLVEILVEGIADNTSTITEAVSNHASLNEHSSLMPARPKKRQLARPRSAALDSRIVPNKNFEENVKHAVSSITDNPILQEILTDTAKGSLQRVGPQDAALGSNLMRAGGNGPSPTSGPQMQGDPMQVFEGAADKWAHLAFANKKNHLPGQ